MFRNPTRIWRHFDVWLLAAVVVLTIAGVAMIQSAQAGNPELIDLNIVGRQTIYALAGFGVLLATAAIDYRIWAALARPIYAVTVILLGLITLSDFVGFGAARWFNIGIVLIQPSELAKILMILVTADYLSRHSHELKQFKVFLRSLILIGVPVYLIFTQPDLSTSIVLVVAWAALLYAAGAPLRHFLFVGAPVLGAMLVVAPFLVQYFLHGYPAGEDFSFLHHYQMERLVNFVFPTTEASFGATYNVQQALISIGSGGWIGEGYGHGSQVQLRFLKVRHTDFIFSAMAEEFGFVGAVLLIAVLMFVIYRCLHTARMARDTFGALTCYGVATVLLFQGCFNIGMNMNLLPVSGLPLPFFSYGGSSLLSSLLGVGLVESVILRHKPIEL